MYPPMHRERNSDRGHLFLDKFTTAPVAIKETDAKLDLLRGSKRIEQIKALCLRDDINKRVLAQQPELVLPELRPYLVLLANGADRQVGMTAIETWLNYTRPNNPDMDDSSLVEVLLQVPAVSVKQNQPEMESDVFSEESIPPMPVDNLGK